jgi:RimJ/RimL family protein N-acetyltransferase
MYEGALVALRAREPEDAEALHRWQSDPETMRWWDRVYPPLPPEALAERIAASVPSFAEPSFMVVARDTGDAIGWCGLHGADPEHRRASLAVMIGEAAYRGRGYGADATRTLCAFAFDQMNLVRVSLEVFPENVAVRRVYERLGFVEEGVQRQAFWKQGRWHDLVHMALFPQALQR